MRALTSILISLFLVTANAKQKLPESAQKIVDALPDKALTLELILTRGANSSESFKEVISQGALVPAAELAAEALFTPQFTASASHSDDRSEPTNTTFSANKTIATGYSLGVSKYFSTGTAVEIAFEHQDVAFNPAYIIDDYYGSGLSLNLSQSLLKDPFGYSSRRSLKAGRLQSQAQSHRAEAALEDWTRRISDLFYAAWISKKALLIADDAVKRRNKLLKTTRLKAKRGTAESPDLLQVEAVQLLALNQRDHAEQELNNHWRNLVLSLKLPSEWIQVDPRLVPIVLDNPMPKAIAQCKSFRKIGVPKAESAVVRMNQALKESSVLETQAKKKQVLPDLSLVGSVAFNGIDTEASESISEASSTDHPAWSVGLNLTVPLSFDSEKAQYLQAYSNQIVSTATFNAAKDDLRIAWMNDCSDLTRLLKDNDRAKSAFNKQRKRERLEDKRFRLGRIPVFNYIQAGDDAADTERSYNQQQVLLRQTSWKVLRNASQISDIMKDLSEKYEKNN